MVKVLLDTNIIIDLMHGVSEARNELSYYSDFAISSMTWLEVMVGCKTQADTLRFEAFLNALKVQIIHPDDTIMPVAVTIRVAGLARVPKQKIKSPDAIIGATALVHGKIVITRNPSDYDPSCSREPYKLEYQKNAQDVVVGWNVLYVALPPK